MGFRINVWIHTKGNRGLLAHFFGDRINMIQLLGRLDIKAMYLGGKRCTNFGFGFSHTRKNDF